MTSLGEVQASLSLFAEAIVDAPVRLVAVDSTEECWPLAPAASLDGEVRLPRLAADRSCLRATLLHQCLAQPFRSEDRVDEELPAALVAHVFSWVESHRVNAQIRSQYPGASPALDRVLAQSHAAIESVLEPGVGRMLSVLYRHVLVAGGTRTQQVSPGVAPSVAARFVELIDSVAVDGATALTSMRVAEGLCGLIEGRPVGIDREIDSGEDGSDDAASATEFDSGVSLDGGTPTDVTEGEGVTGGQMASALADDVAYSSRSEDTEPPSGPDWPRGPVSRSSGGERVRTFLYDEWDYHDQSHRIAWCRVVEERLSGDDHDFIAGVRERHRDLRTRIRQSLLRLRPRDLVRVHRADDGDELDLDAAIEAIVDRRAGAPVDDRLQIRRDRGARDVATALLVDLSASTSSPASIPEPEPAVEVDPEDDPLSYGPMWELPGDTEPVRRVIDVAKDAVALLSDALDELGDRHSVYGFSGTGREQVDFKVAKDFGDRVSAATWAAVSAMKPLRYTRMGPAIRHSTAKLMAEPAHTKLLIVISDGYPQDTDYGRDRHDREYGIQDSARALQDAADAGIETFCLTIDPAGHDYLRVMCPDERYLVVDDVESLPEELAKLYTQRTSR